MWVIHGQLVWVTDFVLQVSAHRSPLCPPQGPSVVSVLCLMVNLFSFEVASQFSPPCEFTYNSSVCYGFDTHWCFSDFAHVIFSDWGSPLPTSSIATLAAPAEVEALFSWPVSYLIFQGPQIHQCEFPTHSQCDNNNVSCHYHKQCFSNSLPCIEHGSYLS